MYDLKVQLLKHESAHDLPVPKYATKQSAGVDLYANVHKPVTLRSGERKLISTGISISLPEGYEAQIRPRSGLAIKHGVTVLNTPGTIDADYRGEIMIIMINLSDSDFIIERGMRIAQAVFAKVAQATFCEVEILDETERSTSGFGSTGVH